MRASMPRPAPPGTVDPVEVAGRAARAGARTSRPTVLDTIRRLGPISRVEVAEATGFTQATVTHAVRALLAEGLVVETGERAYTGGKPRVMLAVAPMSRCAVGLQVGADWAVAVVVDAAGTLVARQRVRGARTDDPDAVVARLSAQVVALLRASAVPASSVVGLGLVLPGTLDLEQGSLLHSRSLPGWVSHGVRSAFEAATGLHVVLGNDATAAAVGELWSGAVGESRAHCTIYMGATIGAGLVLDGQVYRGASGNVGPLGRVHVHRGRYAAGPTVEELAAPAAVAAAARAAVAGGRETVVELSNDGDPFTDFSAVASAAVRGDPLATALVEESAHHLADAVLTLVDLLDLDSIVLAGPSFTVAGSIYLSVLRQRLDVEALPRQRHEVAVALSMRVTDAAAVGAASMVLRAELPAVAEDAPHRRGADAGQ